MYTRFSAGDGFVSYHRLKAEENCQFINKKLKQNRDGRRKRERDLSENQLLSTERSVT
jgi:hypothetical protein